MDNGGTGRTTLLMYNGGTKTILPSNKGKTRLRNEARRILYLLSKSNRKLIDFRVGGGLHRKFEQQDKKNHIILMRLKKKGLVGQEKYPLRGGENKFSWQAYYYLTDDGKEVAENIAEEVDEYKRW